MNTYIGFLRGINVGGNNKLPMKELMTILEGLGLQKVKTYIQSGNVVFQSERADRVALSQAITAAIKERYGFAPAILLLNADELKAAMAANPFPEGEDAHKTLHLLFLGDTPSNPNLEKLEQLKTESERFRLIDKVFYLHAPDGIGRSKLAANFDKGWNVTVTARNWRTVATLMEMAAEMEK